MKCFTFLVLLILTRGVSCVSNNEGDVRSFVEPVTSKSPTTPQNSTLPSATSAPSPDRIKNFFQNGHQNGPKIATMVARVKHRQNRRPRRQWQRRRANPARSRQSIFALQPQRIRYRPVPNRVNPRIRNRRVNQQFNEGRQSAANEDRASALDQSGSVSGQGNGGKISLLVNAVKNPRPNNRRWIRLRPYHPHLLRPNHLVVYPGQWANNAGSGQHSSQTAEALAMVTQRLSKMEASLARLKETIMLHGRAHFQSSDKIQEILVAQAERDLENEKGIQDMLKTIQNCCMCSVIGDIKASREPSVNPVLVMKPHPLPIDKSSMASSVNNVNGNSSENSDAGIDSSYQRDSVEAENFVDLSLQDNSRPNNLKVEAIEPETPAGKSDDSEQYPSLDGSSNAQQQDEATTLQFKRYVIVNETDSDGNVKEVILNDDESVQQPLTTENSNKLEGRSNEEIVTEKMLDASSTSLTSTEIYDYKGRSDQLLINSSEQSSLGSETAERSGADYDAEAVRITNREENNSPNEGASNQSKIEITSEGRSARSENAEPLPNNPTHPNASSLNLQTSQRTAETTTKSVHQKRTPKEDKTLTGTTDNSSAEPKLRTDDPDKASPEFEKTTLQSLLRTLFPLNAITGNNSEFSTQPKPPNLAYDKEESVTEKDFMVQKSDEKQEHKSASKLVMELEDNVVSHKTTNKLFLEEANDSATEKMHGTERTTLSTTQNSPRTQHTAQSSQNSVTGLTSTETVTTTKKEEERPLLKVDFITGQIQNDDMPGVSWVARPLRPPRGTHKPRSRSSWTSRSSSGVPGNDSASACSMQGVLKFTFTPPPKTPARASGKHLLHHGRAGGRDEQEEEEEEEEGERRKLMLELEFQRPQGWVFNLGDSIANNGFSGDGLVQQNDCEAQGYNTSLAIYGSDKHADGRQKQLHLHNAFIIDKVTLNVSDQTLSWDNHHGNEGTLTHASLFALSGQNDSQGSVNYDVYLGLNRVIHGNYRSGHGLCRLSAQWLN